MIFQLIFSKINSAVWTISNHIKICDFCILVYNEHFRWYNNWIKVTVEEMKKQSSKSVFTKKNKTVSYIPESKQNSRITKTNSCIKINSLNSEQCSKVQPISQTTFVKQSISKKQSLNYPLMQIHHLDKPNT